MKKCANKFKLFVVLTLSVLLVGMALFGVFGLNGSIDYPNKNASSYEVSVSVDQNAGDSYSILKSATEEYFASKGITPVANTMQTMRDGKILIYKFTTDVTSSVAGLEDYVTAKLTASDLSVGVEASVNQVHKTNFDGVWMFVLAIGVAVVVIALYQLIMEKLAGALAVLGSSILSVLVFVALMAIVRIPASPFFAIGIAVSAIIGGVTSSVTVNRFREENAVYNHSADEVVEKVIKTERKKYVIVTVAMAVLGVALIVFGLPYLMSTGAQLILAGLAGTYSAYFCSQYVWTALKNSKK